MPKRRADASPDAKPSAKLPRTSSSELELPPRCMAKDLVGGAPGARGGEGACSARGGGQLSVMCTCPAECTGLIPSSRVPSLPLALTGRNGGGEA